MPWRVKPHNGLFIILLAMSVTSIPLIKQALGKKWFSVHQFAYVAIVAAAIHYYWSVKGLTLGPITIGVMVAVIVSWKYAGNRLLAYLR